MPFIGGDNLLSYMETYRILWIWGRYGGGKTSLGYRIAYHLLQTGRFRYMFSNVKCVWNDDPEKVVYRDRQYVDAVFVLDEGGTFIKDVVDLDQYTAFLRKMNIALIIPSIEPPPRGAQKLKVQMVFDWTTIGIPLWQYSMMLNFGEVKVKDRFFWYKPSEIWGVYDTNGVPLDDAGLAVYLARWTKNLQRMHGYAKNVQVAADAFSVVSAQSAGNGNTPSGLSVVPTSDGLQIVGAIRRLSATIADNALLTEELVSAHEAKSKQKKG